MSSWSAKRLVSPLGRITSIRFAAYSAAYRLPPLSKVKPMAPELIAPKLLIEPPPGAILKIVAWAASAE